MITLKDIEAKLTKLNLLIAEFKEQSAAPTTRVFLEVSIELHPGEHYAGVILDESGYLMHHLVLMAERPRGKLNWQAACDWAESIGGDLPNRQDLSLLFANGNPHLHPVWHWASETHADDDAFAWTCDCTNGFILTTHKSCDGSAVAVRRVYGEPK